MSTVNTQVAYILHKRSFRESSIIIDFLTPDHGRLSLMFKGARSAKSRSGGNLLLFTPLVISWQGRGDLPYLKSVERADLKAPALEKRALYSAMYVNELVSHLLHQNDVHQALFGYYHQCLYALAEDLDIETSLRSFELQLLETLGFGLMTDYEADSRQPIVQDSQYNYIPGYGPVLRPVSDLELQHSGSVRVSGRCLHEIASKNIENASKIPEIRKQLKLLLRAVIDHQLGHKTLKSRELFQPLQSKSESENPGSAAKSH